MADIFRSATKRRMDQADFADSTSPQVGESDTPVPPRNAMTQSEFTSGGKARRSVDEAKRNAKFLELMKKQQAPLP